jgi:hypothetical protein
MPWKVVKGAGCPVSKPYAVVKSRGEPGKPLGCHASESKAMKQVGALYAAERAAMVESRAAMRVVAKRKAQKRT